MSVRIVLEVIQTSRCPLYLVGGGMVFRHPAVDGIDPNPACALAVARFLPTLGKITDAKSAEKLPSQHCGGCMGGEATFRFRVEAPTEGGQPAQELSLEAREALARSRVLQGAPASHLAQVFPLFLETTLPPGSILIEKGGPVDGLYVIVSGQCEVLQPDDRGNLNVVAEVGPGDCLGEIAMITGERASATVRTKTDCRLALVQKDLFPSLMSSVPSLAAKLAGVLATRLVQTSRRFQEEVNRGLKGRLDAISPAELVQTLAVSNLSGMLKVNNQGHEAMMFFHGGKLGEVTMDDKRGDEAFYDFLDWVRGEFSFEPGAQDRDTSSTRIDPTGLLLEGLRRHDETVRITRDQMPNLG